MKKRSLCAFLVLVTILAGCTLRKLAWDNADLLAMYQLDRYFDLSRAEEKTWRPKLSLTIAQLKGNAGPELVRLFEEVRDAVRDGLTEGEVTTLYHKWEDFRVRHFGPLADEAAAFLDGLDETNAAHFCDELKDSRQHWEEDLALKNDKYFAKRVKEVRRRIERLYGSVEPEQLKAIVAELDLSRETQRNDAEQILEAQESVVNLLGGKLTKEEIRSRLDGWVRYPATMRVTQRGRALYGESQQRWIKGILVIDKHMTHEQRRHLVDEIEQWARDLASWLREAER